MTLAGGGEGGRVTLYVGTSNVGKLRDFAVAAARALRGPLGGSLRWQIAAFPGLEAIPAPEEDQATLEGNARLKAVYYSRLAEDALGPGAMVLADDSGLEVDVLHGEPGVYSARYAARGGGSGGVCLDASPSVSPDASPGLTPGLPLDERNNRHLLARLSGKGDRRARYRCVLAVAWDGLVFASAEGSVEGEIAAEPRGAGGFGYDPLFYLPELGCTMAELDPVTRLGLSHRGRALEALLARLG